MQRMTHLIMAFLTLLLFGFVLTFPIYMAFFAFLGVLIPDIDIKSRRYHRKIFHNIWFLALIVFAFYLAGIDKTAAIILSIGFMSHLISDALTHKGITPLWPIKRPKFNGPISTGGVGEYLLILVLLMMIYLVGKFI
jgi:membrane-bound metal-dependent hydrolase YbcI (DUF457 family)